MQNILYYVYRYLAFELALRSLNIKLITYFETNES